MSGSPLAAERRRDRVADEAGAPLVVLSAQSHAEGFYRRLGFVRTGRRFGVKGIEHRWMAREPHR